MVLDAEHFLSLQPPDKKKMVKGQGPAATESEWIEVLAAAAMAEDCESKEE